MGDTLFEIVDDEETDPSVKRVGRLSEMDTKEVSMVDRAANQKTFLVVKRDELVKQETRTEDGKQFPAGAYAFVPDATKPSTWKLKLFDEPGDVPDKPSVVLTAGAAQALSAAGFRGQQVQIPADALAGVKARVRAAWLKARAGRPPEQRELPPVLKNLEEDDVGDTAVADKKNDDAGTETPAVNKNLVSVRIDEALTRVQAVKAAIAGAEVKKGAGLPEVVGSELRSIQFMLKGMAGVAKGVALMVPAARDLEDCGEIEAKVKKAGTKVLAEVEKRLEALKADLGDSEMLDATQAKKVDSAADMIAKVFHLTGGADTLVVMKASLTDDQRDAVLAEIEKAMTGLSNLYVALQTDAVVKNAKIAMAPDVGDLLHSHAALIEKAVSTMLLGVEGARVTEQTTIEDVRKIVTSLGDESGTALEHLGGVVTEIRKAATMFRVRRSFGGPEKSKVVLATSDEVVAEFDDDMAAEMDALKRNMEMVSKITKRFVPKKGGPKGYQVINDEDDSVAGDFATEAEATAAANRMNFAGGGKGMHRDEDKKKTKKDGEGDVADTDDDDQVKTGKIGAPMRGDRLNRFKGAITMLKDFAGDLRAGSVSMEKFKKAVDVLSALVSELQVLKRSAAAQTGGVADERGTGDDSLNAGSGTQPGVPEGEISEDPKLNAILKRLETSEADRKKDKQALASARAEVKTLRKRRSAPSAPPADAVGAGAGAGVGRTNQGSSVNWPRDLNDL